MYGGLIVGTATITIASYGLFTWAPPLLARLYDYTPGDVGMTLGPMLIVLGTFGLILGGVLADKRFRDGHISAHPDITVIATILTVIPSGLLFFATSELVTLICLATIILTLSVHVGLTPTALTLITPNELRGQVIAIYVFVLNLIGLGFGPTAVALITDRVFQDTMAVGKSLAIAQCLAVLIGVSLILLGRRAYTLRQQELTAASSLIDD
jgi:MFS family permease